MGRLDAAMKHLSAALDSLGTKMTEVATARAPASRRTSRPRRSNPLNFVPNAIACWRASPSSNGNRRR